MNRSLLADVSLSELQQMRENGLSNAEIAQNLNVSVHTINKYLGPGGPRKPRERKTKRPDYKERAKQFEAEYAAKYFSTTPATVPDTATDDILETAHIAATHQTTVFEGVHGNQYAVTTTGTDVKLCFLDHEFSIEETETMVRELKSIMKFMRENEKLPLTVY